MLFVKIINFYAIVKFIDVDLYGKETTESTYLKWRYYGPADHLGSGPSYVGRPDTESSSLRPSYWSIWVVNSGRVSYIDKNTVIKKYEKSSVFIKTSIDPCLK